MRQKESFCFFIILIRMNLVFAQTASVRSKEHAGSWFCPYVSASAVQPAPQGHHRQKPQTSLRSALLAHMLAAHRLQRVNQEADHNRVSCEERNTFGLHVHRRPHN